jgi:hypothetical protein
MPAADARSGGSDLVRHEEDVDARNDADLQADYIA